VAELRRIQHPTRSLCRVAVALWVTACAADDAERTASSLPAKHEAHDGGANATVLPSDAAVASRQDAGVTDADADAGASPNVGTMQELDDGGSDAGEVASRCRPAAGTTGSPATIAEVVELVNGLPKPVTVECFLQSLTRPLQIFASYSVVSAQPALGVDNPRLFLLLDGLIVTVAVAGDGRQLLEMGELQGTTRSLKAEIEFPLEQELPASAPFDRVRDENGGTVCSTCHSSELAEDAYGMGVAYSSVALRVSPNYEVNFDYVEYQYEICDATVEPERCSILAALFDQGQISRGEFPPDMPVFF
jgi:hypothetical protein